MARRQRALRAPVGLRISSLSGSPIPEVATLNTASPRPFGFSRQRRLLTPGEFRRVQERGRTIDLGLLLVRLAPREVPPQDEGPTPEARLGLAISRKVGNAVARGHVKRRVREAFRHRAGLLRGLDLVVTARSSAAQASSAQIAALFDRVLVQTGRSAT